MDDEGGIGLLGWIVIGLFAIVLVLGALGLISAFLLMVPAGVVALVSASSFSDVHDRMMDSNAWFGGAIQVSVVLVGWLVWIARRPARERQARAKEDQARAKEEQEERKRREMAIGEWRKELLRRCILHNRTLSVSNVRVRMPHNADDFEEVCAEFLRVAGYQDACRTPKGPDGGVDVIASGMVAQCKMYSNQEIPAGPIRQLYACMKEHGVETGFFFVYGLGYTSDAIRVGETLGLRLLYLDVELMAFREVGELDLQAGQPLTREERLSMTTDMTVSCTACTNSLSLSNPRCTSLHWCPPLGDIRLHESISLVWPDNLTG